MLYNSVSCFPTFAPQRADCGSIRTLLSQHRFVHFARIQYKLKLNISKLLLDVFLVGWWTKLQLRARLTMMMVTVLLSYL